MHEDHRERVRKRFEKQDLEHFDEHEVLELMLFYAIPRKNTNEIAHRLIQRFGSFARVMDAPLEELEKVEGMGHRSAVLLKLIRSSYRYYHQNLASGGKEMKNVEDCAQLLMAKLSGRRNEEVYLLCLDAKRSVISCTLLAEGDICSANVSARKVVNAALSQNAVAVVLAHNHPGGFALPSELDHIIVTDDDYVSLVRSGIYSPEALGIYPQDL